MQCPKKEVSFQSMDHNCTNFFSELKKCQYIYIFIPYHQTHHTVAAHIPLLGDILHDHLHATHTDHSTAFDQLAVIYFFLGHVNLTDLLATFEASFLHITSIIVSPRHFYSHTFSPFLMIIDLLTAAISLTFFHYSI